MKKCIYGMYNYKVCTQLVKVQLQSEYNKQVSTVVNIQSLLVSTLCKHSCKYASQYKHSVSAVSN